MADFPDDVKLSKTLSFWLRHRPDPGSLVLDANGWTEVDALLAALARAGIGGGCERLLSAVGENDKQRFELSPDGSRIRARQGHSVPVHLDWPVRTPPEMLYHGTVEQALASILDQGLRPMRRHHVHLSPDISTARRVGARRGAPVILAVRALQLHECGRPFYLTANNVWRTEAVPPEFLKVVERPLQVRANGSVRGAA